MRVSPLLLVLIAGGLIGCSATPPPLPRASLFAATESVASARDESPAPDSETGSRESEEKAEEDKPDPSDPTRIETRLGGGYKYTQFTNDAYLNEFRVKCGLIAGRGIFVVDVGLGGTNGAPDDEDDDFGLTDGRVRYFHLFEMDRTVARGWRGWGASIEAQTQGCVPGTDGANSASIGALGAIGFGKAFAVYPNPIVSHVWAKDLDESLGTAVRFDLHMTWKPGVLWNGCFFKLRPSYSYGLTDDLSSEGSFMLEPSVGGALNKERNWWWDVQGRIFFEKDFDRVDTGSNTGFGADWSVFLAVTRFF